jgi:hypothetical protein
MLTAQLPSQRPHRPGMRVGATLGAALSACLACGGESLTEFDCSLDGRKAFVAEIMTDFYLWYDLVPEPDYASAESPQDLLRQMSFREVDHWSGMQQIVERREYFDQGRFQGLGYSLGRDREGGLRISWVHEGSSAGRAGLDRGALLRRVNGLEVADLSPGDLGVELAQDMVVHTVEELEGTVHDVELSQDDVQITSVKSPTVIDAPGGKVGYLMFSTFVLAGVKELRVVFVRFRDEGVERLVVDLRYNGGGLLRTAALLGSLIRSDAAGLPLIVETYNDRHSDMNRERRLFETEEALNASSVAFLTTGRTASASEQVINGLAPYLPVGVVGEQTLGKPVGSDSWNHCSYAIAPITFHSLNASGEGDYFQGMAPTCTAHDDLLHVLGDPEEEQLRAALSWLDRETCEPEGPVPKRRDEASADAWLPPGPLPDLPGWY